MNMKRVIVLTSITYALKAQSILRENGIYANLTRSSVVQRVRGCGYGVSFNDSLTERAEALLQEERIPMLGSVTEK